MASDPAAAEPIGRRSAAETMFERLPSAAVLLDADDTVRLANRAARALGVIGGSSLTPEVEELLRLAQKARRTGELQSAEVSIGTSGFPRRSLSLGARAERLDNGEVALILDDLTEIKRIEAVRRDFVANVGHEIKTPVGALQLLSEAALDAKDDPETMHRFIVRMQHEALRLSRLVQDLLDLSRLQGGEPLPDAKAVRVDAILDEAIDRARAGADAQGITIVRGGEPGLVVHGDEGQLITAVANLLDNAVSYSPDGTRVAVGARLRDEVVEITVTDQGIGISPREQVRIFERFYRVDRARSRHTGGTGLGLAIVKHTVENHGGEVSVWSRPGEGSTFTIRLFAVPRNSNGQLREAGAS
ncbi:MAG TPA: ATP-binding protein [Mycobacteriales bacterium]|nr:ATP-binding protein [Mycobacteriales bacterium]